MGAIVLTLKLSPRPGADLAPLEQAHEAVQQEVWRFLRYYGHAPDIWDGYLDELPYETEWFRHLDDNELGFGFPDYAGCCSRSQEVAYRWFSIALSAAKVEIEQALSELGYHPVEVPPLREVLDEKRVPLLRARDQLWVVDRYDDEIEIYGDSKRLDASTEERARAIELLDSGGTDDPVESMLRPDAKTGTAFAEHLRTAEGEHLDSILWYASHCVAPSDDLIAALFLAAERVAVADVCRAAERLGARADLGDTIRRFLAHDDGRVRAAALAAASGQVEQQRMTPEAAAELFLAALDRTADEQAVAAERLGRLSVPKLQPRITEAMLSTARR